MRARTCNKIVLNRDVYLARQSICSLYCSFRFWFVSKPDNAFEDFFTEHIDYKCFVFLARAW